MKRKAMSKAVAIGLAIVLVSIVIIWISSKLSGGWQIAVGGLGSSFLSIGTVSIVYELWMRNEIEEELIELVGAEKSSAACRLRSMCAFDEYNWSPAISRSKRVRALLSHPDPIINIILGRMLEAASARVVQIDLILPSPESAAAAAQGSFHGMTQLDFSATVSRVRDAVEKAWRARDGLKKGSRISIRTTDRLFTSSVFEFDDLTALVAYLPSGSGLAGVDNGLVTTFDSSMDAYPVTWLRSHIDAIVAGSDLEFENENGVGHEA